MDKFYSLVFLVVAVSSVLGQGKEGDDCTLTLTGEPGACVYYPDCKNAIQTASYGILPQLCSMSGTKAIVCCKPTSCVPLPSTVYKVPLSGYKAWDYCVSLADKAYPCPAKGWKRGDICSPPPDPNQKDGPLTEGQLPHLVLLGFGDAPEMGWHGSGALISEEWVLTEAWVLDHVGWVKRVKVGGWTGSNGIDIPVKRSIKHPDHKPPIWYNDIGLIQLERPVTFSKTIFPACIHTGGPIPDDGLFYAGFFEAQEYAKNFWEPPTMKAMRKVPNAECRRRYNGNSEIPQGVKDSQHICSHVKDPTYRCKGAFGGALTRYNKERVSCTYMVYAFHAFRNCDVMVTTRVAPYLQWIESLVWP